MNELNKVQKAAFELICQDARFLITLAYVNGNAKSIRSNYISMLLPYIGIFADGAEQWGRKVGLNSPNFSKEEKRYYNLIRKGQVLMKSINTI